MRSKKEKKLVTIISSICLATCVLLAFSLSSIAYERRHRPATNLNTINYARSLLLTIVDSHFRGSWVIEPENWEKVAQTTQKMQKPFDSLANLKIGSSTRDVRKILNNPTEVRNNGKIWIYGVPTEDGTYEGLLEVFFDDKAEYVIGITSFDQKNIVEKIGVSIGDSIDKMIAVYGEPVNEKDFIEDPDNKDYMGLYYLYPRSGIGFLIGQDKAAKNLLVQGVLVFGKS